MKILLLTHSLSRTSETRVEFFLRICPSQSNEILTAYMLRQHKKTFFKVTSKTKGNIVSFYLKNAFMSRGSSKNLVFKLISIHSLWPSILLSTIFDDNEIAFSAQTFLSTNLVSWNFYFLLTNSHSAKRKKKKKLPGKTFLFCRSRQPRKNFHPSRSRQ